MYFSISIVRSGDAIYVRVGDHDLTSRYGIFHELFDWTQING